MKETKPIKVVFGLNDFLVGGMQRQFSEQVRHFNRERFEIILITLFQFPDKDNMYGALPTDLKVHMLSFSGFFDVRSWWKLFRLLQRIQPDLVVSSLFFSNTIFRILKPFVGYASIAREHNTFADRLSPWQRMIDRVLSHFSYCIVAVSSTVADFTSKQEGIPRKKFVVIHNGVDLHKVQRELDQLPSKNELRAELGFLQADSILLNVARLTDQKNHLLLIEGFAVFHNAYPAYKLAIVGSGKLREELETYARTKGVGDAVIFFGHRDDVWRFYKMSDAFVSASQIEGLSNSYLEACAASLPLVATNTAGTDELLLDGKNGYIISEQTPQAVVRALSRLQSSETQTLGISARETAEKFSIQRTVGRYEALFVDAMQNV